MYPETNSFWDGNWLISTFYCSAPGAAVWIRGDILHNSEILDWVTELEELEKSLSNEANLLTMESYLKVKIVKETYQRVSIRIDISPTHVHQKHYFEFWLPDTYLRDFIADCRKILKGFPIRGNRHL